MRFEIEIEEQITRRNSYFVEVEDEGEGEMLLNSLEDDVNDAIHPDDILYAIKKTGISSGNIYQRGRGRGIRNSKLRI